MVRFRYILLAVTALLCGSCIYDYYPQGVDVDAETDRSVTLLLHIDTAAPTRGAASSRELIHSLRIVLVNAADDTIEHNLFLDGIGSGEGAEKVDYSKIRLIRTTPGPKKIFLIANEQSTKAVNGVATQSLTTLLGRMQPGQTGFEEQIGDIWFTPDYADKLLLSSSYEFEIDDDPENRVVEKDFWLVYAATKFEFTFKNLRSKPVSIDALSVSEAAGDMYLMANLDESERTKTYEGENYYWIDWLKKVCDDTTANPDLPENTVVNTRYGWISNYKLPLDDHAPADIRTIIVDEYDAWQPDDAWKIAPGGSLTLPEVYLPESKYFAEVTSGNSDAGSANGETEPWDANQRYTFSVTLTEQDDALGENTTKEFPNEALVNVKALFRHTHVKVTVSVESNDDTEIELKLKIGVCPWYTEEIEIPTFD